MTCLTLVKIDCVILYKDRKWSIYPKGIFYTHSSSLIVLSSVLLFTIKVCRWYAKENKLILLGQGEKIKRYITLQRVLEEYKSTLYNILTCVLLSLSWGRKQKIKATATTFTAEWTLQNKSLLIVYYTSITKSTLIDGLHYLYTIKETAWNILVMCTCLCEIKQVWILMIS